MTKSDIHEKKVAEGLNPGHADYDSVSASTESPTKRVTDQLLVLLFLLDPGFLHSHGHVLQMRT